MELPILLPEQEARKIMPEEKCRTKDHTALYMSLQKRAGDQLIKKSDRSVLTSSHCHFSIQLQKAQEDSEKSKVILKILEIQKFMKDIIGFSIQSSYEKNTISITSLHTNYKYMTHLLCPDTKSQEYSTAL